MSTGLLIENPSLSNKPIQWNTKLKDILPEFNLTDPIAKSEAELLDLMSHRSGYPLHDFAYHYSDTVQTVVSIC
jgi:CubicO group peptidase (beta-lactamase class C family)